MNNGLAELVAPGTVRIERLLPGPIDRVWAYLTESDRRGRWLATGDMDLRVGGAVHLHWRHVDLSPDKAPAPERFRQYDDGVSMASRITRCEPPHVLAYTWGDDSAEVLFELSPRGEHVHLVVTHSGMPTHEGRTSVATGWHAHLAILLDVLEGRAPPNFWSLFGPLEGRCAERMRGEE
jgi:uncharacterized protein YndB with AHSA1/START domain